MSVKFYTKDEKNELRDLAVNIRQLSVAEIADNVYGLTLYSKKNNARYLVCYEHPSLIFDLQKNLVFYNAKTTNGMNCYDFVQFYENCSFMDARKKVNQYYMERDPRNLVLYEYSHTKNAVYKHTGISLPDRESGNFNEMKDYFTQTMAFEGNVVDTLILNQSLYMSKYMHNALLDTTKKIIQLSHWNMVSKIHHINTKLRVLLHQLDGNKFKTMQAIL